MNAADALARLDVVARLLRDARSLLLEGYSPTPGADPQRRERLGTITKSGPSDLVTVYDRKVEEFLVEGLQRSFPGEFILGEEGTGGGTAHFAEATKDTNLAWVLDPIDGTTNFSRAYPFFCSTIALLERGADGHWRSQVGGVYDPLRDELFTASRGNGAWLNRQRLSVTRVDQPASALLTTGFASVRKAGALRNFELFSKITQQTLGVRRDGSAALDLSYVAAGRIDAYWESNLSPWDVAAGVLLVEEAGGKVTTHNGLEVDVISGEILSSNGFLHKWLLSTLKEFET